MAGDCVCDPRSEAAVILRGSLSRVRGVGVLDREDSGRKGGGVAMKKVNRTARSEDHASSRAA